MREKAYIGDSLSYLDNLLAERDYPGNKECIEFNIAIFHPLLP